MRVRLRVRLRVGEGKAEGKAEVARAALRKGNSVDDVAEITGLPRETILELKKELKN